MTEPRSTVPRHAAGRPRRVRRVPAPEEKTRRWPILLLLPLLIAAGVAVQRHDDDQPAPVATISPDGMLATASAPGALSSTWYCAGGTATGTDEGAAEQTIEIANTSADDLTARVTVVPSEGDSVVQSLELPAHSRVDVAASSVLKAPYASAVVEVDGGEVAVSHLLEGPTGSSVAACSSSPSASWYVPSGTTRAGTRQLLALFNPFPSEAVVSVTFEADDGARTPQDYEAIVVPGQRVTVLDISEKVTLRNELATTVTVRSGRVIVDQIQTADGTQDTTESLTVTPAAPQATPTWWFAGGPAGEGTSTVYAVQNPSDTVAEVELQVRLDDPGFFGEVEPFEVSIQPGRYAVIPFSDDGRVPPEAAYTAVAQAKNGVPIVADRVATVGSPAETSGTTVTMGSPVLASRWLVPAGSLRSATGATLIVTNPSSTDGVPITVSTVAAGEVTPLEGGDREISGGGRAELVVPTGSDAPQVAIDVRADGPVVVELRLTFDEGGLAQFLAVPVQGTSEVITAGIPVPPPDDSATDLPTEVPNDTGDPSQTTGAGDEGATTTTAAESTTSSGG